MNLYFRLLLVLLRASFGQRLGALDTSRVSFRVWPNDLDVNLHMNNGRYATLMDLGRLDLMARAGLLRAIRRQRLMPVVTAQHLSYRRSLEPFRSFTLETRVLGWDERSIVLEQRFLCMGEVFATGHVQSLFLGPGGRRPTSEIVELFGIEGERPVPDDLHRLFPPRAHGA